MSFPGSLSIYDGLCKLCVGILLLAWIPFVYNIPFIEKIEGIKEALTCMLFLILAFIIGNLWHHLLTEHLFKFLVNDANAIKRAFKIIHGSEFHKTLVININPNDYFKAYYNCEREKILGTVHNLEAIEAFIRDTIIILFLYSGGLLVWINGKESGLDCSLRTVLSIVIVIVPFLWIALRNIIQNKIYQLVWEGDLYLTNKER